MERGSYARIERKLRRKLRKFGYPRARKIAVPRGIYRDLGEHYRAVSDVIRKLAEKEGFEIVWVSPTQRRILDYLGLSAPVPGEYKLPRGLFKELGINRITLKSAIRDLKNKFGMKITRSSSLTELQKTILKNMERRGDTFLWRSGLHKELGISSKELSDAVTSLRRKGYRIVLVKPRERKRSKAGKTRVGEYGTEVSHMSDSTLRLWLMANMRKNPNFLKKILKSASKKDKERLKRIIEEMERNAGN